MPKEILSPTSDAITEIRLHHRNAIDHRDAAIEHAYRCGKLLGEIADRQGELFGEWLSANLPEIPKPHALNFIKLSERDISELGTKQSILRLADFSPENPKEQGSISVKVESHIQFVEQICSWFKKRTKQIPLEKWPKDSKDRLKTQLEPLVSIYKNL